MRTINPFSILRYALLLALLCPVSQAAAQGEDKKANEWYDDLGYKVALDAYGSKTGSHSYDTEDMIKIAESYRKNADYYNAERWYAQVVKKSKEPIYVLYYAQSLQANGNYNDAKVYFEQFDEMANAHLATDEPRDRRGEMGAQACAAVRNFRYAKGVVVRNVGELNTKKLDFSPAYVDGGVLFASTRDNNVMAKRTDSWINDNFMDIFFAEGGNGSTFKEPIALPREINSKFHEGPLCVSESNDVMYFTRNNYLKGKRGKDDKDITLLKIYSAEKRAGKWTNVTELPFNSDDFHSCHPTLSSDGQKLYFASDRPGGYGGLDIYVSSLIDGTWGEPVNLGDKVNTPGTEAFPFMHRSGALYFASNSLAGLGGLDIFMVTPTVVNEETVWADVRNIGKPFNSRKDDFGLIMDEEGYTGYFTSSRKGGKGQDDIYSWKSDKPFNLDDAPDEDVIIAGIMGVCDEKTGERIAGAKVVAYEKTAGGESTTTSGDGDYVLGLKPTNDAGDYVLSIKRADGSDASGDSGVELFTTDASGEFEYDMKPGKTYVFKVVKAGYEDAAEEYEVAVGATPSIPLRHCVPMIKRDCVPFSGTVFNAVYKGKIIPNAQVALLNKCTGEVQEVLSESDGTYEFCLECGCGYQLMGSKANFSTDRAKFSTINVDCNQPIVKDLRLRFRMFDNFLAGNGGPGYGDGSGGNPDGSGGWRDPRDVTGSDGYGFEGRSIVLDNLYYDFDQSYIRPDAAKELDKVVALLREFPSMEIELSSHTDARGTDKYNADLSQRRADEAVVYIVSKGISQSRIVAKGYGERYPRNRCRDNVDCTEEEHQYNRRTEVKITRFDEYQNIDVNYLNSKPEVIDSADPSRKWIWD